MVRPTYADIPGSFCALRSLQSILLFAGFDAVTVKLADEVTF